MKRLTSYWLKPFEFDDASTRAEIRKYLKNKTDEFLRLIAEACGQYEVELKATVHRKEVKKWRNSIEQIGQGAGRVATALRELDPDCARMIDQGYVLTKKSVDAREKTLCRIDDLAQACKLAITFRQLNPGEGPPIDHDRRSLTRACAEAYRSVTGKEPSTSSNGSFARVLLSIEHAVHATPRTQSSISKRYLESVLVARPN